jgi:hypothetical protein
MDEKTLEQLVKLGALFELIKKCREMVGNEGLVGGHRGSVDDNLQMASNEVFYEIEKLKNNLK